MVANKNSWKIWDKDDSVEQRTYKRVKNELPEMECAKQLAKNNVKNLCTRDESVRYGLCSWTLL